MDQELAYGLSTWGNIENQSNQSSAPIANNDDTNSYTDPQLVHQSVRTSIYRHQDRGIKILLGENLGDPQPHQWQIARLENELNVSRSLPHTCKRREVVGIQPYNGHPVALFYKWSNGITLTEWMHKVQHGVGVASTDLTFPSLRNTTYKRVNSSPAPTTDDTKSSRLNVRLRAAMAITKTLSEFHSGGVVHNNISPENIVLDTFEGDYVATLIDLSEAVILANVQVEAGENRVMMEKKKKQEDLKALGEVLKKLFHESDDETEIQSMINNYGVNDSGGMNSPAMLTLTSEGDAPLETWGDETRRQKRTKAPITEAGEGLPIYLGSLISTLLLTGCESNNSNSSPASTVQYESAIDAYHDLKIMLESKSKFYRQTALDERMMASRLKLPTMFYGRQVQMSMLMHLFQNVLLGNQPSIATISGPLSVLCNICDVRTLCLASLIFNFVTCHNNRSSRNRQVNPGEPD